MAITEIVERAAFPGWCARPTRPPLGSFQRLLQPRLSRRLAASLSNDELQVVLAHEVWHATQRRQRLRVLLQGALPLVPLAAFLLGLCSWLRPPGSPGPMTWCCAIGALVSFGVAIALMHHLEPRLEARSRGG